MSEEIQPFPDQEFEVPAACVEHLLTWYNECRDKIDKIRESAQDKLDKQRQTADQAADEAIQQYRQDLAAKDLRLVSPSTPEDHTHPTMSIRRTSADVYQDQKDAELTAARDKIPKDVYDAQVRQTKEYTNLWYESEKKFKDLENKRRPYVNEDGALAIWLSVLVAIAATFLYMVFKGLTWWLT